MISKFMLKCTHIPEVTEITLKGGPVTSRRDYVSEQANLASGVESGSALWDARSYSRDDG